MKNYLLLVAFFAFSSLLFGGNIVGSIQYKGAKIKATPLKMSADPVCVQQNKGKTVVNEDLLVSSGGGVENVFVYIKENAPKATSPAPLEPLVFDQKGCLYTPRIIGVRVGQTLKIQNSDPTLHNVHSLSKVNPSFNLGMPTVGQVIERKFDKPELAIRMKCDVHGWMNAYVHVMDHPFFAVSNAAGQFQISNVPAGKYTLEFWHEKLGTKTATAVVPEGKNADIKIDMGG